MVQSWIGFEFNQAAAGLETRIIGHNQKKLRKQYKQPGNETQQHENII
jgi:hypothetical protein